MKKKTIVMAGASGLIGTYMSGYLKGYEIIKVRKQDFQLDDIKFKDKFRAADIIINFSGTPVIRRWTKRNKKEILDSRILTTRKLGSIFNSKHEGGKLYISASAIGIYDDENIHTEESTRWGKGFMTEVVKKWEAEAGNIGSKNTGVCILRTGVVLSESGGMLQKLLPFFRMGLGARIGKGTQFFSWIHIRDLARAVNYLIENKIEGIVNLTAPGYSTNREFTKTLGSVLDKPAHFVLPAVVFSILYGKGAAVVTGGQAAVPERLIKEGFHFIYGDMTKALKDIVN